MTMDGPVPRSYEVSVFITSNGFCVLFNDVPDMQTMDERIGRAVGHIDILEGPVLRSLSDNVSVLVGAGSTTEVDRTDALRRR